jgi:hypothetical protein
MSMFREFSKGGRVLDGDRSFAIHHRRLWMKLECERASAAGGTVERIGDEG